MIEELIPRRGLLAWHEDGPGATGYEIPDKSGNGRDLEAIVSPLPFAADPDYNGQRIWNFDDDQVLLHGPETITIRHAFVVAAYAGASFPSGAAGYAGLLTGISDSGAVLLVGQPESTRFYDFDLDSVDPDFKYHRNDVSFVEGNMQAGFNGKLAVFEVSLPLGKVLDGIQYGYDRDQTGRQWAGPFACGLLYDRVLSECERQNVYNYFAAKYHLWPKAEFDSVELDRFPFPANKSTSQSLNDDPAYSEPYSGQLKALRFSSPSRSMSLPFMLREQAEFEAAEAFYLDHLSPEPFVFRDHRYLPPRDRRVRFDSQIEEAGSDTSYRFNYSFEVAEV